jgi:two-component system, NarL family, response regulator LiaR
MELRAVIVEDHDLFRDGLRRLLEGEGVRVVGEAADGEDGVRLALRAMPDVVVMDIGLPRVSGIEATRRLAGRLPVVVLTAHVEDSVVLEAVRAGATGYILKDADPFEIVAGIRAAAAGDALVSPAAATGLLDRLRRTSGPAGEPEPDLSEREREVLHLLVEGCDNAEIAERLVISAGTVKNHVSSVLTKLGVDNRIQAAVYAVRRGIA